MSHTSTMDYADVFSQAINRVLIRCARVKHTACEGARARLATCRALGMHDARACPMAPPGSDAPIIATATALAPMRTHHGANLLLAARSP